MVLRWSDRKAHDDLIIIDGTRGIGKTTLLLKLLNTFEHHIATKLGRISGKITDEKAFFSWLSELFDYPINSIEEVHQYDASLEKPIVFLVDDIHNLFLGKIGGFVAYCAFLRVINLNTKNILWCLTVTSRAWSFLKGVFGEEQIYGKIFTMANWNDSEIQKLITIRHSQSGLPRKFDDSIKAYGSSGAIGEKTEAQFFRLLWGQSRGNPRAALMYWVSAITLHYSGYIDVGVPSFINSSVVSSLSDDSLFVLAALSRHDNLTLSELELVTNIADNIIKKCVRECQEKDLLWADDEERYRVSSRAQYVIDYFLMGKNFLYE